MYPLTLLTANAQHNTPYCSQESENDASKPPANQAVRCLFDDSICIAGFNVLIEHPDHQAFPRLNRDGPNAVALRRQFKFDHRRRKGPTHLFTVSTPGIMPYAHVRNS